MWFSFVFHLSSFCLSALLEVFLQAHLNDPFPLHDQVPYFTSPLETLDTDSDIQNARRLLQSDKLFLSL